MRLKELILITRTFQKRYRIERDVPEFSSHIGLYDTLSWTWLVFFLWLYLSFGFELFERWHAVSFSWHPLPSFSPETRAMPDLVEGLNKCFLLFTKIDNKWNIRHRSPLSPLWRPEWEGSPEKRMRVRARPTPWAVQQKPTLWSNCVFWK